MAFDKQVRIAFDGTGKFLFTEKDKRAVFVPVELALPALEVMGMGDDAREVVREAAATASSQAERLRMQFQSEVARLAAERDRATDRAEGLRTIAQNLE